MNNTLMLLLAVSALPASYIVVSEVAESQKPPAIRRLTAEELAKPPMQLSEYQKQPPADAPKVLPKGVQLLPQER